MGSTEENPADERRAGKCQECNGTGQLCRCRGCGTLYRHIHKYSDCGNVRCEGKPSDDVTCPDCGGTGFEGVG